MVFPGGDVGEQPRVADEVEAGGGVGVDGGAQGGGHAATAGHHGCHVWPPHPDGILIIIIMIIMIMIIT